MLGVSGELMILHLYCGLMFPGQANHLILLLFVINVSNLFFS